MGDQPTSIEEYQTWLRTAQGFEPLRSRQTHYETAADLARQDLTNSAFWGDLVDELTRADVAYQMSHDSYPLLGRPEAPVVHVKPFQSALEKSFRINVLLNPRFPEPPDQAGWILPAPAYFGALGDVVRTLLVVKYVDGVEFLATRLQNAAEASGYTCRWRLEARGEGYYAAHMRLGTTIELPKLDWDTARVDMVYEIQITTQLQEVIRRLTHRGYEHRRLRPPTALPAKPWQWTFDGPDFSANYLGHILHYLEGVILELRKTQEEDT